MSCPTHDSTDNNLVVFKMDSNLINAETIDEPARAAGVVSKVEEITWRAMCRYLDFKQELAQRRSILEKASFAMAFNPKPILREYSGDVVTIKKIQNPLSPFLNLLLRSIVIRHSMSTLNSRITKMPAFLLDREAQ